MVFLGIDIGVTGAMAALGTNGDLQIFDLPVITRETSKAMVKRRLDPRGCMEVLRQAVRPGLAAIAVYEAVHTMPGKGNSPQAGGSLMHSLGVVESVLAVARIEAHQIAPSSWKREMGLIGKGKDDGRAKAIALFPRAAHHLRLKKHHNRADALLLAFYAKEMLA